MATQPRKIDFAEFALHLGSVFDDIEKEKHPIVVERAGHLYRVELQGKVTQDIWAGYDPGRVRDALKRSAGALSGVDREKLVADIHAQRGQDSRGRPAE
jgi:hypothetical protein